MKPSEAIKFSRPLWKHQADTLDWDAHMSEVALLHEMGTGKTTSAIAWLRAKFNMKKDVLKTLIVSPVATLPNWLEELERNAPPRVFESSAILYGTGDKRIKLVSTTDKRILITNPETFDMPTVVKALGAWAPQIVIVDEAHRFKNPKSRRLKSLTAVSDAANYRMILTGTPILNSYLDIWAQWRIVDRGDTLGLNFFVFREQYFEDANLRWKGQPKYFPKYVPKPGIDKALSALIDKKASRLRKEDCLTLPPLVRKTEYVELSPEQKASYVSMENELIAYLSSGACVATNALTRVLRMLQILSGYAKVDAENWDGVHKIKDNPRLQRLKELLEEITPNHKVIVWCVFQENYKAIKALCEELSLGYGELTGQTKDREDQIQRFRKDPACRVFISNPQAGGVGVNLIEASYMIYYSRSFSLGDRLQSEARNHRGGSEIHASITLIDLVAQGTLDEDVLTALSRKESFSDNILDRLKERC